MEGIDCVEVVVESAEDEVEGEEEAAGVLDAAEVEAEVPVGAEDTDEELGVEVEVEDKGEEEEEWVEGEVWEALFAGVLEDVSLLGEGFEDWPQPARIVKRAREAERAPATFNAFPAFTVSSLLEVKRNITGQAGSFNKREKRAL